MAVNNSTLNYFPSHQKNTDKTAQFVMLVDSYSSSEGRAEIKIDSLWNSICDPNWNIDKANAVCNLLGFMEPLTCFKTPTLVKEEDHYA